MERTLIQDLHDKIDSEVSISGWVDIARNQGKVAFFDFRDRTGKVQGVVFGKPELLETAKELRPEWVVRVTGKVNKRPDNMVNENMENGDIEIEITTLDVLSKADGLPFDLDSELHIETYLDHLPLTLRKPENKGVFEVQSTIAEAFRESLKGQGFTEFQSPGLVGGDAEGGAGVFEVPYFNEKTAYLATSPQFYKQIMVGVFERSFTVAKAFRAEKHATTRHLSEYTSLDYEFGFIKDHTDVMGVHTNVVKHIVDSVSRRHEAVLKAHNIERPLTPDVFPAMKLREAQEIIKKETGEDCTNEPDLEPSHERFLCEYAREHLNSDFIFITHYPVSKRPFYTYEDENDPGFTKSFDLLFRGVEITTGGQRIHDYDTLVSNIKKWKLEPEKFEFYLETFKYGLPRHGGCATGIERLTQKLLGVKNVKEATLFPRDIHRIDSLLSKDEPRDEDNEN